MKPKVSVIVPVYNVEKYLEKCLTSLVNQTLSEIEIIIVNDGSTDNSEVIINDFKSRFPEKIKTLTKKNGGLSDARNSGLDICTGQFIAFVDSDDFVDENMFAEMLALALKYNAEMVICNLQKVNEHGFVTQKLPQLPNFSECMDLASNFSIFSDISYFACNKLFKRELFANKRFVKGMHFEDIELIPQLLLQCTTITQTQNFHYQYLEREDSITKTHSRKGLDILKAVQNVEYEFRSSTFSHKLQELKNFQILEGVYTFLAYLAFVKDDEVYKEMSANLKTFIFEKKISRKEIINYNRFGKNYLKSLPFKKQIYYYLYFCKQEKLLRLLMR